MIKHLTIVTLLFFSFSVIVKAQSTLAHEVGVIFGPVAFQSDFGQRHDFSTNINNTGFGIGIVHFLNFSYNSNHETYFNEHFKVRSELSYNRTQLNHFGEWAEKKPATVGSEQLRLMEGKSSLVNLGLQLEYSPFMKIHDFENIDHSFSPYISLGTQISFYATNISSSLGQIGTTEATFPKYLVPSDGHQYGFSNENGAVWSVTSGIGTHFKLSEMQDLLVEARFQFYNSDWIDGLNPNKDVFPENKANDWQVWLHFGYVFYLN